MTGRTGPTRRAIIATAMTLPSPAASWAQEIGRTYRVGGLLPFPFDAPQHVALLAELRRLGFIEGQNLKIDARAYELSAERLSEAAVELVKAQVDVILAGGDSAIRAAQQATTTIPILAITDDMVGSGLVKSLARPGANTTGISLLATELDGKRQEILIDMVSPVRHIAALADPKTTAPQQLQALHDGARARGVELSVYGINNGEEIAGAINTARAGGAGALNVLASPLLFAKHRLILDRTAAAHLPAMYQWPEIAEEGGLAAYGPRIVQLFREVLSRQLVKLLLGVKPADLPVEQPTKFELVVNLKTAKGLGLTVPPSILGRADEVIE
jgi:putative tryptophan/tyrosine transport system substrate-binding protein